METYHELLVGNEWERCGSDTTFVLFEDGSFSFYSDGSATDTGTWEADGSYVYFTPDDTEYTVFEYYIEEIKTPGETYMVYLYMKTDAMSSYLTYEMVDNDL